MEHRIAKALTLCSSPLLPFHSQGHGVSTRTAVCLVPVPTVEHAALLLVVATHVHVLLATQVLAALMTQMNVLPHPPYARMKEYASTTLALTSENLVFNNQMFTIIFIILLNKTA